MDIVILAAVAAVAVLFWVSAGRLGSRLDRQSRDFRDELKGLREETQSALSSQIGQAGQGFQQQLGEVRKALQKGLTDAGELSSRTQATVGQRLDEAAKLIANVSQQLGSLQEAGRELSGTARTLEAVLSGAKTRGSFGELALDRLLDDTLPRDAYEMQYRFRTGAAVDAAVHLGDKILPIDSKFPLDSYRRLVEAEDESAQEVARKEFARAVRKHAADIAEKYILPAEGTLDVAFLFLASEGVYYELLGTEDNKGSLAAACREMRVVPVSPNTLYAYLAVILMGLRGLQVEENARAILGRLSGLQTEVRAFQEVYSKLGTHLKNATQSYQEAAGRLDRLDGSLTTLVEGDTPAELEATVPSTRKG